MGVKFFYCIARSSTAQESYTTENECVAYKAGGSTVHTASDYSESLGIIRCTAYILSTCHRRLVAGAFIAVVDTVIARNHLAAVSVVTILFTVKLFPVAEMI